MILDPTEEKYVRDYIKRQDEKVIRKYFVDNPKVILDAKRNRPTKEGIYDITSEIRCSTEVDVSTHRVMKVMKELMGIIKPDEKKDDC